ncbi:MAG: hypothetical protein II430_07050 [Selenomonas sp.]|uniref:hypothetical protein n=1 Tax=Selenomonas sp. AE3005 TaxID=1485543 RepID=UPI000A89B31F|nr:hypothetical protein [Selenomonas sp. AE3005]MBQ1919730.1 hypothetical protein [Selenomonas sp.]MBQ2086694.1 hypothetical protein [Selenomonas sp.]MBQ2137677.1 hypothetical protein [Selenomonas sp.]MBQ5420157.1 hypothetical protein [Selenomonas sp.]
MRKLYGYIRTWRAYVKTPKGSHDTRDYGRALLLIAATVLLVWLLLYIGGGF